mgnify:CR=1 FL=1
MITLLLFYIPEQITGLTTNISFLIALCGNMKLLKGEVNTAFIEENKNELLGRLQPSSEIIAQVNMRNFSLNFVGLQTYL